jgi:hypothetical protein
MSGAEQSGAAAGRLTRRDVLRRGATAGAVLAWTTPAVMTMSGTAWAQTEGSPQPTPSVSGSATVSPTVRGTKQTQPGVLPRTGSGLDIGETVALGTSLVAAGAAIEVARRRRAASQPEPKHT